MTEQRVQARPVNADKKFKIIDLHTHILPENLPNFTEKFGYGDFIRLVHNDDGTTDMYKGNSFFRRVERNCFDPEAVLDDMDRNGVDVQVLCTVPVMFSTWAEPEHTTEIARFLNDDIAATVKKHPRRFVGLGCLPMNDPDAAIVELRRCIQELGLKGVQIGTHIKTKDADLNLDHPSLFPIFQEAEKLGAAVFVHPWDMMGQPDMPKYWLPWLVGMPAEAARAICCLIFGGVFERLPNLRVCFAHGGGSFPATYARIEHGFKVRQDLCAVDNPHPPSKYLGQFWVDSWVGPEPKLLKQLVELCGEDKIALGTDYPFPLGEVADGLTPGCTVRRSDFSDKLKQKLLWHNAVAFLGLDEKDFLPQKA